MDIELNFVDLSSKAVGLEDVNGRLVHETAAVNRRDDSVVAVQVSNEGDHRLSKFLAFEPLAQVGVGCVFH